MIAPTEAKAMVDALIDDIVDMAESYACLCVGYRFLFLGIQDGESTLLLLVLVLFYSTSR